MMFIREPFVWGTFYVMIFFIASLLSILVPVAFIYAVVQLRRLADAAERIAWELERRGRPGE
ncbi:MAG: hypothetical protein FWJ73_05900 [Limnochordales bacterium]|nr:hypothetical protein [Bacillota bacterium]